MKSIKISPFRVGRHEFYRSVRGMAKSIDKERIFSDLVEQRTKVGVRLGKQLSLVVILFIILSSTQSDLYVEIKTALADVKITKLYVVFALALATGVSVIQALNFMTVNDYVRVFSARVLGFDNANVRSATYDASGVWAHLMNVSYRFFQSGALHKTFIAFSLVFILSPIFLIYYMSYSYELSYLTTYLSGPNYVAFGRIISVVGLIFLIFPVVIVIFTFFPIEYIKNVKFIRWIFLLRIYIKNNGSKHDGSHWGLRQPQPGNLDPTPDS